MTTPLHKPKPPPTKLFVLTGNGLSIAANPELRLDKLTDEIRRRFEKIDPSHEAPDRVLARLAARGSDTGDPYRDFEAMIGPLDQQKENLSDLAEVAELVGQESKVVRSAIRTVTSFLSSLRRLGAGHACEIIAQRSVATLDRRPAVENFLEKAVFSVEGSVCVGNLNYDSLAMASLLDAAGSQMCDMVRGYGFESFDLLGDGTEIVGSPMRPSVNDFPFDRRIKLVHPHGSLTWLKHPTTGKVYRFDIGDLRDLDFWAAWRDGKTEWEPQVVLTNQSAKSDLVTTQPFKLAYDVLYQHLLTADRWLIAGYSFRDECVNALLAKAWAAREEVPSVLVVTVGEAPTSVDVQDAVGFNPFTDPLPEAWLQICRCGIASAPNCARWHDWAEMSSSAA